MRRERRIRTAPRLSKLRRVELSALETLTAPQLIDTVEQLQRRLAQVQDYALNRSIRTKDEIESCAEEELEKLRNVSGSIGDLMYLVNYRYTPEFFYNEPDTTYKIYLCNKIADYLKSVVPNFTNSLIEGIAQDSIEYYEYIKNPILEG